MTITTTLQTIGKSNHPLSRRELKALSALPSSDRDEFLLEWKAIKPPRRIEIASATVELAEDNVDLDFNEIWHWMLDDQEAIIRERAIEGLWEDVSPRALRRMLEILRDDPAVDVRSTAAGALSRFAYLASVDELEGDADALHEVLISTLTNVSEPADVRRRALESAGYFGDDDTVAQQITTSYAAAEQPLRESALVAMGRSMLPRWLPTITKELGSPAPALRYEAARAAGEMGEEARGLVAQIAPLAADKDTEIALAAIWALGQVGGEPARRTLKRIRDAQEETRSQAAAEALDELTLGESLI